MFKDKDLLRYSEKIDVKYQLLFLTLLLLFNSALAEDEPLPSYCRYFPALGAREIKDYLRQEDGAQVYQDCLGGRAVFLEVGDLLRHYLEIEKQQQHFNVKSFRNRMVAKAIKNSLAERSPYLGLFGATDNVKARQQLKECMQDSWGNPTLANLIDDDQRTINDQAKQKSNSKRERKFLQTHMLKTLIAHNLEQRVAKGDDSAKKELYSMIRNNPLLFTQKNNFSITNWFDYTPTLSPLGHQLINGIDNKLKEGFSREDLVQHSKEINQHFDRVVDGPETRALVKEKIEQQLEKSSKGALHLCESDGKHIHHFAPLVKEVMTDSYRYGMSSAKGEGNQKELIEDLSGYCYLLAKEPLRDLDAFTWQTGSGLALVASGTAAQFVPFIGNLVGYGLILGGGALLAHEGTVNYLDAKGELATTETMHSLGWAQYSSVLDQQGQYSDKLVDLVLEGTVILDVGAVIKAGKAVARARHATVDGRLDLVHQQNKELVSAGKIKEYRKGVWSRHQSSQKRLAEANPENRQMAVIREQLMFYNSNDRIPAYYRYGASGDDTFGAIDVLSDASKSGSDEFGQAIDDANHWVDEYSNYQRRLNDKIDEGFTARAQLNELTPYAQWSRKEFQAQQRINKGRPVKIELTVIENGVTKKEVVPFPSFNQLRSYLRTLKRNDKEIFAANRINEGRRASEMFEVMADQARYHRKLTFVRERLGHIPKSKRTTEQQTLLTSIDSALAKKNLVPREDAVHHLQILELRGEIRDSFRSTKGRVKLRDSSKFSLGKSATVELGQSSAAKSLVKYSGLATVTGGLVTTGKGIVDQYQSESDMAIKIAEAQNMLDRAIRSIHFRGGTFEEVSCAQEPRMFTFEKSCYPKLARKFILPHVVRSVQNPVYRLDKDPEVATKLKFYRRHMLRLRHQLKGAETFNLIRKDLRQEGLRDAAREQLIEGASRMAADQPLVEDLRFLLSEPDEKRTKELQQEFNSKYSGQPIVDLVNRYLENEGEITTSIADSGALPPSIQQQLKEAIAATIRVPGS